MKNFGRFNQGLLGFTLASVLLIANSAQAAYNGYDRVWPQKISEYFHYMNQTMQSSGIQSSGEACRATYKDALESGNFKINYALGYFDESSGNDRILTKPDYQISVALDGIAFDVIRGRLTSPCDPTSQIRLCGFSEEGDSASSLVKLSKSVELYGRNVRFEMTLTHASASESYEANRSSLAEHQSILTRQSEENFFGGLSSDADAIFYNGHSRNGGGPDFNPPLLRESDFHPDYATYIARQTGIKRMLSELKASSNKNHIVGMFSCFTRKHFAKRLTTANPGQKIILSEDSVNYLDTVTASLGYLEGILQGQCGANLKAMVGQNPTIANGFTSFNF